MRSNFELIVTLAALAASTFILICSLFLSVTSRIMPPYRSKFSVSPIVRILCFFKLDRICSMRPASD